MKTCKMGCGKMSVGGVKPKSIKKMAKGGMAAGIPYMAGGPTDSKNGRMKMGGSAKKKMGMGGMHMMPDGTMMPNAEMMKRGGKVGSKTLKPVPAGKVGLSKLPTPVRNKMGYMKIGGSKKK